MADNPADMAQTLKDNKELYQEEQARLWRELGPVFFKAREEAGLTQKILANKVGTTDVTIHNIETGQGLGACSVGLLSRIADVLMMLVEIKLKAVEENDR